MKAVSTVDAVCRVSSSRYHGQRSGHVPLLRDPPGMLRCGRRQYVFDGLEGGIEGPLAPTASLTRATPAEVVETDVGRGSTTTSARIRSPYTSPATTTTRSPPLDVWRI